MNPRIISIILFFVGITLISCGGKSSSADNESKAKEDNHPDQNISQRGSKVDSSLSSLESLIDKELSEWVHSFKGFQIDSFRPLEIREFQSTDYQPMDEDLRKFYELYKPSLCFSPDNVRFIDLFSNGISLEKKGKKIIAAGDADQGITLYDTKTKEWKTILSFGPSAGIEEAVWNSPTQFILAGTLQNDEGKHQPMLLLGDTEKKIFRWFEANIIRDDSTKYEASGLSKLKIDEWE